ncbi:MAG: alpha/beta hydrolase [Promethearchaeota archaeon]|jgi:acetyl esterase/lipase
MPIFDITKIKRPEILKILEFNDELRKEAVREFFSKEENQKIDFTALWQKVTEGNVRWLNDEDVQGLLTIEEMRFIANLHRAVVEHRSDYYQTHTPLMKDVKIDPVDVDGVPAEWEIVPKADDEKVILYFHGGGYIMGTPNSTRMISVRLGFATRMRILSVDYRLAPDHPYPEGLEDCITSYKWLLSKGVDPKNIIISGDSAGGYYALITLVHLKNKGIPLPSGAIVFSPATDLAMTGDSFNINAPTDPILADLGIYWWVESYLAGVDPFSPDVSPLYADLTGLSPILIQASTSEMLLDDAQKFFELAQEAGVDITLQTWDATLHEFQINYLPESEEAFSKTREFVEKLFD